MSDAARLARQSFASKPRGVSCEHFVPVAGVIDSIKSVLNDAISESAYAAMVSYAEALSGLQHGSVSWSIVRLYYSCFYSIRALLLLNQIVPFNCKEEMILDVSGAKFFRGGRSSHHWNWSAIRKVVRMNGCWFVSADSQESYEKLRKHRESVNYTHAFTDPYFHQCLVSGEADLGKRFRAYRDDNVFFYTYLADHLAIAYPTKLVVALDQLMRSASIILDDEKVAHIKKVWIMRDRCPMS